jgi:hypothetical protein
MKTQKIESYLISQGYDFNPCFMGYPKKVYRLTFRGDYFAVAENYKDVILKCIFHDDERNFNLLK